MSSVLYIVMMRHTKNGLFLAIIAFAMAISGSLDGAPWAGSPGQADSEKELDQHLIVIGADAYRSFPPLSYGVSSATQFRDALTKHYGVDNVVSLLGRDAKKTAIIDALDDAMELGPRDSLIVYFCGHGWIDEDSGKTYWVPVEAPYGETGAYLDTRQLVEQYFERFRVGQLLVVSDCCFSGDTILQNRPDTTAKSGLWRPKIPSARWFLRANSPPPEAESPLAMTPFTQTVVSCLENETPEQTTAWDLYQCMNQKLSGQSSIGVARKSGEVLRDFRLKRLVPSDDFIPTVPED